MDYNRVSIEHILPQNPKEGSQWVKDFTDAEREEWTNCLGNLILISPSKNNDLGRLDFVRKKEKYFKDKINTFPNSVKVMEHYDKWTPKELKENHKTIIDEISKFYDISLQVPAG